MKVSSLLGWLLFACCVVGAVTSKEDGPITAWIKGTDTHRLIMTLGGVVLVVLLFWLVVSIRRYVRTRKRIEALRTLDGASEHEVTMESVVSMRSESRISSERGS